MKKYTSHTYTSNREDLTDFVNELKLFIALISEGNISIYEDHYMSECFKRLAVLIDEI